jgi:hypothetical protein
LAGYSYLRNGALEMMRLPSGRQVFHEYDEAGRAKRVIGYAARVESARLIHLAISAEPAPMVNSARMRRSRETEGAPASILATRDWLDPN